MAGAALAGIAYVMVRKIGDRASAVVMVLYYGALSLPMCVMGSGCWKERGTFLVLPAFRSETTFCCHLWVLVATVDSGLRI